MGLVDDLKTFVMALALGVALTLSINYVVVNHTEGSRPAQVAVQPDAYEADDSYQAPKPVQRTDTTSSGYGSSY